MTIHHKNLQNNCSSTCFFSNSSFTDDTLVQKFFPSSKKYFMITTGQRITTPVPSLVDGNAWAKCSTLGLGFPGSEAGSHEDHTPHLGVNPKIMGKTPKSSHFNRVFHCRVYPFWGFPPIFGLTPIYKTSSSWCLVVGSLLWHDARKVCGQMRFIQSFHGLFWLVGFLG